MLEKLFDKPPAVAISWVRHFLAEAWCQSEILRFQAFCEEEYRIVAQALDRTAASDRNWGRLRIDRILYHLKDECRVRSERLARIARISERLNERLGFQENG